MAKRKRKLSPAQRDKTNIMIAKELKKSGILSKQTKLHSGKYISRHVLKKVRQYENMERLNYGAVKVSKETTKRAKERGFEVVQGNRIIGPKTPSFRNKLKKADKDIKAGKEPSLLGVKPVRGGYLEQVDLPHTIYDLRSLVHELGEGIDTLKLPEESFAFKYKGNESYRVFPNSAAMLEALLKYELIQGALSNRPEDLQEEFEAISLFRLHEAETPRLIPGATERRKRADAKRRKRTNQYKQRDRLSDLQLARVREIDRLKKEKKREELKNNPAKYAAYLDKMKTTMRNRRGKTK